MKRREFISPLGGAAAGVAARIEGAAEVPSSLIAIADEVIE